MKRALLTLCMAACCLPAFPQTKLVSTMKPVEQQHCSFDQYTPPRVGNRTYSSNSFYLKAPDGGLIASQEQAYATYELKGQYEKLSFITGPVFANPNGDNGTAILVVQADGRTLLDIVIHDHDEIRFFTLNVAGADRITFKNVKGGELIGILDPKLWKAGQIPVFTDNPMDKLPQGRLKLVEQHKPYFTRSTIVKQITDDPDIFWNDRANPISINRKTFDSGLQMTSSEGLVEDAEGWSYFWLNKRYSKISFIAGPRDNQSSNSSAWLVVKADGRTIYEEYIRQTDLAKQVVLDVSGKEQISFHCQRRSGDLLGSMTFGVVDIYAYPEGYDAIPEEGVLNLNKEKIAKLPDVCPLMSNIRPFSVRGFSDAYNTLFYGETRHYCFSMGGIQYWEGMLFTTGNTLFDDMIDSFAEFDLGGEYDYISFDAGCLSKNHILDDDKLRIYADDKLVFDHTVYCTWPNQHYEIPVYKCRTLRFEKPGNGKQKQTIIGVGDVILYRGKPVANDIFVHDIPDCPYETDLIDLCGKPYFHYCGRFASSITNFSMDDCFHDGSTKREFFTMPDGRQIYKGFLLETNIPLGIESITLMDAAFMFMTGVGANLSSSNVAAHTGTTGGAGGPMLGGISLLLADSSNKQSSAAAFNPFGEYESCTFTVECAYSKVDEFDEVFGNKSEKALKNPVKLNVFADQILVGEYWLTNGMEPLTMTVPIFKCHQLMFWLECGDQRSGQYVFHDLKLSKAPCSIPVPESYTPGTKPAGGSGSKAAAPAAAKQQAGRSAAADPSAAKEKKSKAAKPEQRIVWDYNKYCKSNDVSAYLNEVTRVYKESGKYVSGAYEMPKTSVVWVQARDGSVYKCVSFLDSYGKRLSISNMMGLLSERMSKGRSLKADITLTQPMVAAATVGLASLESISDMTLFGKYVKTGTKVLSQCKDDIDEEIDNARAMIDYFSGCVASGLSVDGKSSSDTVLILRPEANEKAPASMQRLEYFDF